MEIILGSDSRNVVSWTSFFENHPWKLENMHRFVVNLANLSPLLHFEHIFHETNWIIDSLAKQGVHRDGDFIA